MVEQPDAPNPWDAADAVVGAWYRRARESQFAHYAAGERYEKLARRLGIPVVVLSAAAGTTLLATLQEESTSTEVRIVVGLVSLLAAVLASLQTFLGFAERSDKHRAAATAYGAVRREIEQHQAAPPQTSEGVAAAMARLRERLDGIAAGAPDVPPSLWERARGAIEHTERPEGFRRTGGTS